MSKTRTHAEVVETYAKAVGTTDLALLRTIFADDMELVSSNVGHMRGVDNIIKFFGEFLARMGGADPHPGPILIVDDVVAVEIEAHHGNEIHEMSDFFTIKNGKVIRLAVYQGPIRKKSAEI